MNHQTERDGKLKRNFSGLKQQQRLSRPDPRSEDRSDLMDSGVESVNSPPTKSDSDQKDQDHEMVEVRIKSKNKEPTPNTPEIIRRKGYVLLEIVGMGGFSQVYRALRLSNQEIVACKVFDLRTVDRAWMEKCLKQEMRIMLAVNHPNLVHAYDVIKLRSSAYIFMEFAGSGTISSYMLTKLRPIREWQAREWFYDVMCGVDYLHSHRIAHRDLKLENFLLNAKNRALVTDYGFACFDLSNEPNEDTKQQQNNSSCRLQPIQCHTICGTPEYMAPEIYGLVFEATDDKDGKHKQSPPPKNYDGKMADIYSMGVCLFEMVNFFKPFLVISEEAEEAAAGVNKPTESQEPNDSKYAMGSSKQRQIYRLQLQSKYRFNPHVRLSRVLVELIHILLRPEPDLRPTSRQILNCNWLDSVRDARQGRQSTVDPGTKTSRPKKNNNNKSLNKSWKSDSIPEQKAPPKSTGNRPGRTTFFVMPNLLQWNATKTSTTTTSTVAPPSSKLGTTGKSQISSQPPPPSTTTTTTTITKTSKRINSKGTAKNSMKSKNRMSFRKSLNLFLRNSTSPSSPK